MEPAQGLRERGSISHSRASASLGAETRCFVFRTSASCLEVACVGGDDPCGRLLIPGG